MSKYDTLDARSELEQTLTSDLKDALAKRGFTVVHHGTANTHAPQGLPDIEVSNGTTVITFEATRSRGAQQDRELNSIRDHLNQVKANNARKQCYCVFVGPSTSTRMIDGIRDHNRQRASENRRDLKILPLSFANIELWTTRLSQSEADLYPVSSFLSLFDEYPEFVDDLRVRKLLNQHVFPNDPGLADAIEREETERDQQTLEQLIKDLARLENFMRQNGIATSQAAIDTLIYLVFMKLYEEKRERDGMANRLLSEEAFRHYRENAVDAPTRRRDRAIHELFNTIKQEGEFVESRMFTEGDVLRDTVTDQFIFDHVIPIFAEYKFLGTRIDALGAVYEVLALRADKDVKVGQFFTPENVVRFMTKLAELEINDMVLDPACGTGRFLIHAMNDMLEKVDLSNARNKAAHRQRIRLRQLYGADIDSRIAKIAKMNMWIHGDGKSNVFGGSEFNGLTLHRQILPSGDPFDGSFDVVLTNPPLGELNYQVLPFAEPAREDTSDERNRVVQQTIDRIPTLPRRNLTEERLRMVEARLQGHRDELQALLDERSLVEHTTLQQIGLFAENMNEDERQERVLAELHGQDRRSYRSLQSRIARKQQTVQENEQEVDRLQAQVRLRQGEWEITGNTMKGGALFLSSIWHYLKPNAYPDMPPEWRGGRMLIVLDEGILNTDAYSGVRGYLRSHFYIKAVVSLTRDTFVPISKTATKTSIVYAVKKTDLHAIQQEPVSFGHVERVGLDTKGRVAPNDLDRILTEYLRFKEMVLASYVGLEFRRERFAQHGYEGGWA